MELCEHGDLKNYVSSKPNKCLTEEETIKITIEILEGIKSMHELSLIHR